MLGSYNQWDLKPGIKEKKKNWQVQLWESLEGERILSPSLKDIAQQPLRI